MDGSYPDLASNHGSDDQRAPPAKEASTKVKPSEFRQGVRSRSLCSFRPHTLDCHERIAPQFYAFEGNRRITAAKLKMKGTRLVLLVCTLIPIYLSL